MAIEIKQHRKMELAQTTVEDIVMAINEVSVAHQMRNPELVAQLSITLSELVANAPKVDNGGHDIDAMLSRLSKAK